MKWTINKTGKISNKSPIMIEGLPGMGNVGKIAVDFIIDNLKAEKVIEIFSSTFPHCVFINEDNLIELPKIEIYQKKLKSKTLLLVAGDIQPIDEVSCYEFCNLLIDIFQKHNGSEIITLGGIGQHQPPKNPKLYYTGNSKKMIKKYAAKELNNNLYNIVGPIIGVSGVLIGVARTKNIPGISILAETYNHPTHLGLKGAKSILKILNDKLNLKLKLNQLDTEINEIEQEIIAKAEEITKIVSRSRKKSASEDVDYIG